MSLLCPSCKTDLVMSERQGVEIDYCPKCRGVWLDRGELDKIIERADGPGQPPPQAAAAPPFAPNQGLFAQPQPARPPQDDRRYDTRRYDDDDDDRRYGYKKRKNWLSEMFD
jgi:uncharacterized protein